MKLPDTREKQLADFPPALRQLIDAELAAGNSITEISSCFPAPPAGAYVKLARAITTRPHAKTPEVNYYDRNSSLYSGEWTDAKRFFFVLEPPHPPEPEVNMDEVRNARRAASVAADEKRFVTDKVPTAKPARKATPVAAPAPAAAANVSRALVTRFEASMVIDYEKWHDGIGYDLTLLKQASAAELKQIEEILLRRGASDWRDVEALAALDTDSAKTVLRAAMKTGNAEIRGAVLRHAPGLVPNTQRIASLVDALRSAGFYGGLTQALDEVAEFHPPEVMDELFRGALERQGDGPVHFAAMLMFLHGKAKTAFDWSHRPFYLKFNTKIRAERETLFRELCEMIGVDPAKYLGKNAER